MAPPSVTFLNSTEVRIEWNEGTFHKGGPIKDYEIRVSHQKTGQNHTFRVKPHPGKSVVTVGLDRISAEQVLKDFYLIFNNSNVKLSNFKSYWFYLNE